MGRWVSSPSYRAAVRVLVDARKAAGLTQRALAAKIGRPYTVIANIERGVGELDLMARVGVAIGAKLEL